jgi:protein SCO1/2
MRTLPLIALAALLAGCGRDAAPAAEAASAPGDFSVHELDATWLDQDGRPRTLSGFGGETVVLAMVYTSCTHTCPAIVAELKRIDAGLDPSARGRTRWVLVSLDPARDTPQRLREWAAAIRLDPARWTLLTGDDGSVRELAALIGIRYRTEANGDISHSNSYLVLDPAGRIVHRQNGLGADGVAASLDAIAGLASFEP